MEIQPLEFDSESSESESESTASEEANVAFDSNSGDGYDTTTNSQPTKATNNVDNSLFLYEQNLIDYKGKMDQWNKTKKDAIADQTQYEETIIELIRVYVSAHGRIPTDEQIQDVLNTTADQLTEYGIEEVVASPPPDPPKRPSIKLFKPKDKVRLSQMEASYALVSDALEMQVRDTGNQDNTPTIGGKDIQNNQINKGTCHQVSTAPHGLKMKLRNQVIRHWKILKLVHVWLGKEGRKTIETEEATGIGGGNGGGSKTTGVSSIDHDAASKRSLSYENLFTSSVHSVSCESGNTDTAHKNWQGIKKSIHKSRVDDILNTWIHSWHISEHISEHSMDHGAKPEKLAQNGDLDVVRALFEEIDQQRREYFTRRDLKRYLKLKLNTTMCQHNNWSEERIDLFLKQIGVDQSGSVTWVAFAMTNNILGLFDISELKKSDQGKNSRKNSKKKIKGRRNVKIKTTTTTTSPAPIHSETATAKQEPVVKRKKKKRKKKKSASQLPVPQSLPSTIVPHPPLPSQPTIQRQPATTRQTKMKDRLMRSPLKKTRTVLVEQKPGGKKKRGVPKKQLVKKLQTPNDAVVKDAKKWAENLSKDWIQWLQTSDSIDIVVHLNKTTGGVNTIVDRILRRTALHYASETGDVLLSKELCKHPMTLCQLEDSRGETSLDIALRHRHMVVANIILNKMIQNNQLTVETGLRRASLLYNNN